MLKGHQSHLAHVQTLDGLLGNWRANDTLRSMHADMEVQDVELITAWLRRHHMITLKPFLKVMGWHSCTDSTARHEAVLQR